MKPYNKLLVAVMDSPAALHAGGQGLALAASMGASVVGVSVVPSYEGNMDRLYLEDMRGNIEAPHRKALEALSEQAEKMRTPCRTVMVEGKAFEGVVDIAEAEEADLIVLGGVTRALLARSVLGTTAVRVIGYSHRDTLVVPESAEVDFSRILLATDGSRECESAVSRALQLAKVYGGELRAVSVVDTPSEYHLWEKVMDDYSKRAWACVNDVVEKGKAVDLEVQTAVRQAGASDGIIEEAEEWDPRLIVVGTHGRTGLKRLMLGSVAAGVLRRNLYPTLVCA